MRGGDEPANQLLHDNRARNRNRSRRRLETAGRFCDASGGSVWLFVSNRSVTLSAQAAIRMDSSRWRSAVLMTAANERSPLTESTLPAATDTIELPPLSLIRIEYEG